MHPMQFARLSLYQKTLMFFFFHLVPLFFSLDRDNRIQIVLKFKHLNNYWGINKYIYTLLARGHILKLSHCFVGLSDSNGTFGLKKETGSNEPF